MFVICVELQAGKGEGGQMVALLRGWDAEAQVLHPPPHHGAFMQRHHTKGGLGG